MAAEQAAAPAERPAARLTAVGSRPLRQLIVTRHRLVRLLAAVALPACASTRVDVWPVEPRNPTSATFDIPVEDARALVLDAFCLKSMLQEGCWVVMAEPEEGQDIRLQRLFGDLEAPYYYSPVYHSPRGPLVMMARFRIRISAPEPERTTVEVIAEGTRVIAGRTVGHLGFLTPHGSHWIVRPVAPTTVEEHAILHRCAKVFGVRDFPDTVVPANGIEGIVDILVNDDKGDRMAANDTLVFLDVPAATDRLVTALEQGGRGGAEAAFALGQLHATAALPALRRAATSGDLFVRESAAEAIRAIRPPRESSIDALVEQLQSRSLAIRFDAALALERAGKELERARPVLESFLGSDIPSERWRAAAALVRIRRAAEHG